MYLTAQRSNTIKTGNIIFILLAALSLSPVWIFPHFVTADGPCHLYNSMILNSWLHSKGGQFYSNFYHLNMQLVPNWFTHILLLLFIQIFNPVTAEKILISLCFLLFTFGFRYLVNSFEQKQAYLSYWSFLFFWQFAMLMGFYNYMFSIGAFFWIAGYWIRNFETLSLKQAIALSIGCTVIYFMHLFGLILAFSSIGMYTLLQFNKNKFRFWLKKCVELGCIVFPSILLTVNYIHISHKVPEEVEDIPFSALSYNIKHLTALNNISIHDRFFAALTAYVITALLILSVVSWLYRKYTTSETYMSFMLLVCCSLFYFTYHEGFLGGAFIEPRLQVLVYLLAVLCRHRLYSNI